MSFQFIENPNGNPLSDADFLTSALEQPLSLASTAWETAKGGVLESFGLGTAIRDLTTPDLVRRPYFDEPSSAEPVSPETSRRFTIEEASRAQQERWATALSEDQYKASPFYRESVPWEEGMTEARAESLSEQADRRSVREFYASKRPITAFVGNLAGQAADPINYIPIAGEIVAAANIARFGRVAGRAVTASADAMANTAAFGLMTAPTRKALGDDVSWQTTVSQIAVAGLIGAGFGAIHGRFGRASPEELRADAEQKLATLENVQKARVALNDAIDGLVQDGEVRLSPLSSEYVRKVADEELPKVAIERMAREADAEAFSRLETLDKTHAINTAEIQRLQSLAMDNERFGPTRRAMIEVDQLNERLQRAEEQAQKAPEGRAREQAVRRRDTLRDELREKVRGIDDARVQEIENIEAALGARREVNVSVAEERARLLAHVNEVRSVMRDRYWTDLTERRAEMAAAAEIEPTTIRNVAVDAAVPHDVTSDDGGVRQAAARVGKPEASKEVAEQFRVDPETGDFAEMNDIEAMRKSGRLTEEDEAALAEAEDAMTQATGYGEALKAFARCVDG